MSARRANLLSDQCRPTPELRGAGGRNQGKTGQSVTPRPLERRVGLPLRERKPGRMALAFFNLFFNKKTCLGLEIMLK